MGRSIFASLLILWFAVASGADDQDQPARAESWYPGSIGVTRIAPLERPREPVVVAIVDDGVRISHRDLSGLIWDNPGEIPGNRIDDDGNGYVDDVHGWDVSDDDSNVEPPADRLAEFYHGTHLAGIVMQLVRDTFGGPVADLVRIMPVKALSDTMDRPYLKDGYRGIDYAIRAGADIVLCAWAVGHITPEQERTLELARDRGVLVVASAGNYPEGREQYPAAHDSVLAVAALDRQDQKLPMSNFGEFVELSAPGIDVSSTAAVSDTAYEKREGTSQAAAMVAGAAAVVELQHPSYSREQVVACLKQSAVDIEGLNERYNAQLGAGKLDVGGAVACPLFDTAAEPERELSKPQGYLRIEPTENGLATWAIRVQGLVSGIRFTPRISEGGAGDSTVDFFREESGQPLATQSVPLSGFPDSVYVPGGTAYVAAGTANAKPDLSWLLEYRAEPIDRRRLYCSGTVDLSEEGTFEDGSGADDYSYDSDCKWQITAPEGKVVEIRFVEFDTQTNTDLIYFFNGTGTHEDIMAIFSGHEIPPVLTTWSNRVLVWFVTDGDVQGKGWKAEFRFRDP